MQIDEPATTFGYRLKLLTLTAYGSVLTPLRFFLLPRWLSVLLLLWLPLRLSLRLWLRLLARLWLRLRPHHGCLNAGLRPRFCPRHRSRLRLRLHRSLRLNIDLRLRPRFYPRHCSRSWLRHCPGLWHRARLRHRPHRSLRLRIYFRLRRASRISCFLALCSTAYRRSERTRRTRSLLLFDLLSTKLLHLLLRDWITTRRLFSELSHLSLARQLRW